MVLTWNNLRLLGWNEMGLLGWDRTRLPGWARMRLLGWDNMKLLGWDEMKWGEMWMTYETMGKQLKKKILFVKIRGQQCSDGHLLGKYLIHQQLKILLMRTGWVAML